MQGISNTISFYQQLQCYDSANPGASDKIVGAEFAGKKLQSLVTDDVNSRCIRQFNTAMKSHVKKVDSAGISLRNAKKLVTGTGCEAFYDNFS